MVKFFPSLHGLNLCLSRVCGNLNSWNELFDYVRRCRPEEVFVDSGVHKLFHKLGLKDYPKHYILYYYNKVRFLSKYFKDMRFYAVIPDVPADYSNNPIEDNVAKTVRNIEEYLKNQCLHDLENVTVLAVVQGRRDSVESVVDTYLRYGDLYSRFAVLGLGPTCTTRSVNKLSELIMTFDNVVNKPYHVFGPNLSALRKVIGSVKRMHSFDSSAFYRKSGKLCIARVDRDECLLAYMDKLVGLGIDAPKVREGH